MIVMRKLLLSFALLASLTTYAADTTPVWCDPSVNQQNREPRRADFFAFENIDKAKGDKSASGRYLSMEGLWRFCFVKNHQDAPKAMVTRSIRISAMPGVQLLRAIPLISARRTTIRVLIVARLICQPTGKGRRCSSM